MLAVLNRVEVAPGDVYYLPAGTPHAIGAGVTIVELQEPTAFSIIAEHERFGLDEAQATLGVGWDDALACFDLAERDPRENAPAPEAIADGVERLFPEA